MNSLFTGWQTCWLDEVFDLFVDNEENIFRDSRFLSQDMDSEI